MTPGQIRSQNALQAAREGEAALARGEPALALKAFERWVTLEPDSAAARANLGAAFAQLDRRADAEAASRAALEIDSDNAQAAHLLATLMCERDLWAAGLVWLRHAVALAPENGQIWLDLGAVQLFLGKTEAARDSLLRALELDPAAPEALFNVVRLVNMGKPSAITRRIDAVFERIGNGDDLPPVRRAEYFYARGKTFEDRKAWDQAFAAYAAGASSKRSTLKFDIEALEARFEAVAKAFSRARISGLKGAGAKGRRPIFIFGMPRSGTTLVEQIIAAHPEIQAAGETSALLDLIAASRGPSGAGFPAWVNGMTGTDCANLGQQYLSRLPAPQLGRSAITDKRLENFEFAGLIDVMLNDAVMINCRRDPRDNGWACFSMLFSTDQLYTYSLEELGRYWKAYDRLVRHWREVLEPERYLEVSYEEVVADLETWARRIIAHTGLEWDDACLSFHTSRRPVRSASAAQVRQPVYTRSVGRWRPFAEHLKPMFAAMGIDAA